MSSRYVIVTPAYNEQRFLAKAIESVLAQTMLPDKWVIVDDGSTDGTPEIVKSYAASHSFIQYHARVRKKSDAYFASNVFAIHEGCSLLAGEQYDFLAILDADIILPSDYYQRVITEFDRDPTLGVASGVYENLVDGKLQKMLHDRQSTPKALQVFRREVFEKIGGYLPLPYGGEDTVACVMTRMQGMKAWSFPDVTAIHLRPTGTGAVDSVLKARFRQGMADRTIGSHPLFFLGKVLRRMVREKPYFLGGLMRFAGYCYMVKRKEENCKFIEVKMYLKSEQLRRIFGNLF